MSWQDILKEMDAEEEFERDALRRDIEAERYSESYESPGFKKVEEKLFELINLTIPQDREMLQIVNRRGFNNPKRTRRQLDSALREAYQAQRELAKIKEEAKKFADENPQSGPYDGELLDEIFQDSDSEFATDRGFQMLMSNEIGGMSFGFARGILSDVRQYEQLFSKNKL